MQGTPYANTLGIGLGVGLGSLLLILLFLGIWLLCRRRRKRKRGRSQKSIQLLDRGNKDMASPHSTPGAGSRPGSDRWFSEQGPYLQGPEIRNSVSILGNGLSRTSTVKSASVAHLELTRTPVLRSPESIYSPASPGPRPTPDVHMQKSAIGAAAPTSPPAFLGPMRLNRLSKAQRLEYIKRNPRLWQTPLRKQRAALANVEEDGGRNKERRFSGPKPSQSRSPSWHDPKTFRHLSGEDYPLEDVQLNAGHPSTSRPPYAESSVYAASPPDKWEFDKPPLQRPPSAYKFGDSNDSARAKGMPMNRGVYDDASSVAESERLKIIDLYATMAPENDSREDLTEADVASVRAGRTRDSSVIRPHEELQSYLTRTPTWGARG